MVSCGVVWCRVVSCGVVCVVSCRVVSCRVIFCCCHVLRAVLSLCLHQLLGVDLIACVSVDSAAVMGAWRQSLAIPRGLVFFYGDPDATLAKGLDCVANTAGTGRHYKRFVSVIKNGTVIAFAADPVDSVIEVSSGAPC